MAIIFDAVASSEASAVSSLTYSHTVGVGENTIIVAQPTLTDLIAGAASISSVTYAAVAMTLIASSTLAYTLVGTYDIVKAQYGLVAPATGANNVVVTASEACDVLTCGSLSWFGVHQSSSYGTAATATGTSTTPSVDVASATGEIVVAHASAGEQTPAIFASADTERWEISGGAGNIVSGGASQTGAATVTMDWTGANAALEWGCTGVSLKPADTNFWFHWHQRYK